MEPIENVYFNWLCAKILYMQNPTPSLRYDNLLACLHREEFAWSIVGDDNRARDGVELRMEFLFASRYDPPLGWMEFPCSVLEMLIAFSKRAEHMSDIPFSNWFWTMIENLGLKEYNDARPLDEPQVREVLHNFVWRLYDRNGFGGLFPIANAERDQRNLQIWYQFCDYVAAE